MIALNRLRHGLTQTHTKMKLKNELCQDPAKPLINYHISFSTQPNGKMKVMLISDQLSCFGNLLRHINHKL